VQVLVVRVGPRGRPRAPEPVLIVAHDTILPREGVDLVVVHPAVRDSLMEEHEGWPCPHDLIGEGRPAHLDHRDTRLGHVAHRLLLHAPAGQRLIRLHDAALC